MKATLKLYEISDNYLAALEGLAELGKALKAGESVAGAHLERSRRLVIV